MCGRTFAGYGKGFGPGGRFDELDTLEMRPGARVVAVSVLAAVAFSGVFLAFTPVWWIFTTYFWVAFPAFRLLAGGIAGMSGPGRVAVESKERELLLALKRHGEISPARAAVETSLSVAEADKMLGELAEGGYLEVRARGGGIFYALWENKKREPEALTVNGDEERSA